MKKKLLCLIVFAALLMTAATAAELSIAPGTVSIAQNRYWCNTSATSVTIPSGVRDIGSFAFYGCSNITKVSIPNTVTQIDGSAFRGCSSLTSVTIPSSVTAIGSYAFYGCSLLNEVTIAGGVTSIGNGAFGACGSLKSISIPASVTSIGNGVFASDAKPTITCTQGSYADTWARTYGYARSYVGAPSVSVEGNLTVCVGGTAKIVPKVFPAGYTVTYTSSDTAVAKVAGDGNVTGIAAGHATVTVKAGSMKKTVDVQVVTPVSTFTLSESELLMAKGRSKDIETVEMSPMQAYPELTASSSDTEVVTVSGNTITAVGAGDAVVTFSSINSVRQTVQVHVVDTAYPTAEFAGPATRTIPVELKVVTGDSVTAITLANEGAVPVKTWKSGYTDSEGVRVWNMSYAFGNAGSRKLYILTSDGGRIPVSVQVNDLVRTKVFEAVFEDDLYVGVPADLTVKTPVYAKYLQMYSGSTLLKTWNMGYADKDGIRTWMLSYTFAGPGVKGLSFCASEDGSSYGEKLIVYPTVGERFVMVTAGGAAVERVLGAAFDGDAYRGIPAALTVVTAPTVTSIRLCSENGAPVYSWDSGYEDKDGKRIWQVSYRFAAAGNRRLSVSASADGKNYGEGFPVAVKVNSGDAVLRAAFIGTPAVGTAADIELVTPTSAVSVRLNAENGNSVKMWTSGYTDSGNLRTWHVQYTFQAAGKRDLSFSASMDGVNYGTAGYVSTTVEPALPVIRSARFDGTATVGTPVAVTVRTGLNAKRIVMYSENGSAVASWTSGYTDTANERVWVVSYTFTGAGTRSLTFKASADGSNFGSGVIVKEPVMAANVQPKVSSVSFLPDIAVNTPTTITVKTTTNTRYIAMYAEGGGLVRQWSEGYTDSGTVRTWNVEYMFAGEGNRQLSFKASADGMTWSAAVSAGAAVNPVYPSAYSVRFDRRYGEVGKNINITVTTSANAKKLMLCCESGTVCASWNANGNSTVSGNIRTWTVQYAFEKSGERYIIFKTTADGSTFGSVATGNIEVSP